MNKTCPYCAKEFSPSLYHADQEICSSVECQRKRRADYHRKKLSADPAYRDQCRDSQRKWREKNSGYMRQYRARRRAVDRADSRKARLVRDLRRFQNLAKNNSALDLTSLNASIWLLYPDHMAGVRDIFAKAKVVVIEGINGP